MWTDLHASDLCRALRSLLGKGERGAVAFVRCLPSFVVHELAKDTAFAPDGWVVRRVAGESDPVTRTIMADEAVELRESKESPVLLLVDVGSAGAGMDGIYSAARELHERELFKEAIAVAAREVTKARSSSDRRLAEQAIKKAKGHGQQRVLPPWTEFDFLVSIAASGRFPGEFVHRLGLWPVGSKAAADESDALDVSRRFVDRLLGPAVAGQTPGQRIASLKLSHPTAEQVTALERLLREAATIPIQSALELVADQQQIWIGALQVEAASGTIRAIKLEPWFNDKGKLSKWSGLTEQSNADAPPELVLDPEAEKSGNYSKLEVRWRSIPSELEKDSVSYRVAIVTDMEEELVFREVAHSAKKEEKCRFSNDDFAMLNDDALVSAKVVVSVLGSTDIEPQESEEFQIRFGVRDDREPAGIGKKVRCLSEGLIELEDREVVSGLASSVEPLPVDSKGYLLLRTPQRSKSYRVFTPPLLREVERSWFDNGGAVGRWRVRVRASGARAAGVEFVALDEKQTSTPVVWERATVASRRMSERFASRGGCGQVYDQTSKQFDTVVKEYLLAWAALLDGGSPHLALANTVEVQSLSGRTIGLIVLPSHALRVAWHVAYDNLVLHSAFEEKLGQKDIRNEFAMLDGAMFPAFLPGLSDGSTFVFADTLGFHTVGMVADSDKEPKAALAILTRALGDAEGAESAPTIGRQSSQVLGDEILKYLRSHNESRFLQIHALRAGDGLTVARSLGHVQRSLQRQEEARAESDEQTPGKAFVLELYPSQEQRVVAGRFIAEAREKRRTGAGTVVEDDRWMLESLSLPGGISLPRLRWARKEADPSSAAHIAVAFDTFESCVSADEPVESRRTRPFYAYGLLSFFDRQYSSLPSPVWHSRSLDNSEGEKHPADRFHTERLSRLQQAVHGCVATHLGSEHGLVLKAEISPEKAMELGRLHRLCDWVITLDRNAGMEYFDSPRDNKDIYDAYVIDCVPEREDLGCLQLITSTSNLEEVRRLLDSALDQMGLSHSRRNAEFLMSNLKALSGRLAIRLTGQRAPTSELIALALSHAYSRQSPEETSCWPSLRDGFIIPVDDVQDLLPPVQQSEPDAESESVRAVRPDLLYVRAVPRSGLQFRFVEVKYRRHLRDARSPDLLSGIHEQVDGLGKRWQAWYSDPAVAAPFRAVRRAKLARVLRFYADKARRHSDDESGQGLSDAAYRALVAEIERMIEKGADYSFAEHPQQGLGWIFCPEYAGLEPLRITPDEWGTQIFLFGPRPLPDGPSPFTPPRPSPQKTSPEQPAPLTRVSIANAGSAGEETNSSGDTQVMHSSNTKAASIDATAEDEPAGAHKDASDVAVVLGTDLLTGGEVSWPISIKGNPHLLVAGLPGMGKTTCLLSMVRQMLDGGIRPIVFSYHEDIDEHLADMVEGIRFVEFTGLGFNPLQVIDRSSRMGYLDVAGTVRDIFAAIFPELGDIQGERIRTAIKQSFVELGWDGGMADLEAAVEPPFKRFFEILQSQPKPDRGLQTLLARLGELADYGFFDTPVQQESLWESDQPIIVCIHKTQNEVLQNAFASLVFYKLYKDMFRRGTQLRITHAVIFDEAHRAARLTLIPTMAKECRKYGVALVLASQEARDFHMSLYSAIANYLVLRVTEADAKVLIRNVSSSDQERSLIDKIKQMEKYRALYFTERQKKPSWVALRGE